MKAKYWIAGWLVIIILGLLLMGGCVYKVDPYFHYHKPDISKYYYVLDNQRSQNDGIIKHFEYDALITGTSMTQNFKSSEMDEIFDCRSIKVPFVGATYKEINDNISTAIASNSDLKIVVRGLDMGKFMDKKDKMSDELGEYPNYLYDDNPLNDVEYLLNRDVLWGRVYPMIHARKEENFEPGITSFDEYSRVGQEEYGLDAVCPDGVPNVIPGEPIHLSESKRENVEGNIRQNVISLAEANPDIQFYYFITPYSAISWGNGVASGAIYRQIEAEERVIEMILECDNIKLFSFNNKLELTCNLDNYRDEAHYGEWINSEILQWMHDGDGLITKDNYKEYLEEELNNYLTLDYDSLGKEY